MKDRKSYGVCHIESKITDLLKPLFKSDKKKFLIINNITKNWEKIVGKKYVKFCEPKSINFYKNSKENYAKLTISVFNSAVGFFLQNNSEILLERIATLYGYRVIDKIIIKQESKEIQDENKPEIHLSKEKEIELREMFKNVENEELKASLISLGRDILGKNSAKK